MKQIIRSEKAPPAIGPYSQGVSGGGLMFTSGQLPIDPSTGALVEGGIAEQTRRSLENVRLVLMAAGSSLDRVVKVTVFLNDMDDFAAMNTVYGQFFGAGEYPARSAVQVARLPKDALVEIEVVALA